MTAPSVPANRARSELIREVWAAAWDRGEVSALDRLLASDYRRLGAGDADGVDLEQFKASITTTRSAFPDLVTHVDDVVVDGDRAAVRWRSVGTHQHSFLGVPATRRPVEVSGATFAHFGEDDLVHVEHVTWDPRALLAALGIITIGADR